MAARERLICASDDLPDGGKGVRFETQTPLGPAAAFAVRHGGKPFAYVNRCGHVPVELDWQPGECFAADERHRDHHDAYFLCAGTALRLEIRLDQKFP